MVFQATSNFSHRLNVEMMYIQYRKSIFLSISLVEKNNILRLVIESDMQTHPQPKVATFFLITKDEQCSKMYAKKMQIFFLNLGVLGCRSPPRQFIFGVK